MAVGGKYVALTEWLQQCDKDSVRLSFDKLNKIIPIPNCAYSDRPSWANLTKPTSFCAGWLNAGYLVDAISLRDKWVVFKKGVSKRAHQPKPQMRTMDQKAITTTLQCGYNCYDDIAKDPNHRYLSWEYCHEAFKHHRYHQDEVTVDYLCLHLAWYLASWGMLRNSFLLEKDYKIHAPAVQLLYQPEWTDLWDIAPDKLAQEQYATKIVRLRKALAQVYVGCNAGMPTETLLTKILLGTIGCAPAYDRYFKKALSVTGVASQRLNAKSLMALGRLYIENIDGFEALRRHCGERVEYPAAKIIDMCFFEYGLWLESRSKEQD